MERLLEQAKRVADQVAVYSEDSVSDGVDFENSKFKNISSGMESGVNLLLIKDGRMGSAYTRNLIDRDKLISDALASLANGVAVDYELPRTGPLATPASYDPAIEKLTNSTLVDECRRVCRRLQDMVDTQINVGAVRSVTAIRLLNSKGTDLSARLSSYQCSVSLVYPGSYAAVRRNVSGKSFVPFPDAELEFLAGLYNASRQDAKPKSGRTRVLFLPEAMYALVWRLTAATDGKSVYEGVSPLRNRVGDQVLSEKVTLSDEPLDDQQPGARAFDDEGTPTRNTSLIERGVLRGFYYDLFYAAKSRVRPTGHGYRSSITTKTVPSLEHVRLGTGESSFRDLLAMMGQGVIVAGVMGAHSGNVLNGDYSIGLSPGLWVEQGEIVGRVKDAMVSGNVYDTMRNVIGVEDRAYPTFIGQAPAMLFDDVSFTTGG
ncbi:MAG: metallopeptidase TldD-related protein [candidate division WOR-3 bacterium]